MKPSSTAYRPPRVQGFAYLWMLLSVAFVGLGLVAAADLYSTGVQRDKEKELLSIGRQFRTAIRAYHAARIVGGRREYPAKLEDLLEDDRFPGVHRHLRQVFVDPITGTSEWGLVLVAGRIAGIHSLSQKTPIKQDGFDPDDASFAGRQAYAEWTFTHPADLLLQDGEERGMDRADASNEAASAVPPASSPAREPSK